MQAVLLATHGLRLCFISLEIQGENSPQRRSLLDFSFNLLRQFNYGSRSFEEETRSDIERIANGAVSAVVQLFAGLFIEFRVETLQAKGRLEVREGCL